MDQDQLQVQQQGQHDQVPIDFGQALEQMEAGHIEVRLQAKSLALKLLWSIQIRRPHYRSGCTGIVRENFLELYNVSNEPIWQVESKKFGLKFALSIRNLIKLFMF